MSILKSKDHLSPSPHQHHLQQEEEAHSFLRPLQNQLYFFDLEVQTPLRQLADFIHSKVLPRSSSLFEKCCSSISFDFEEPSSNEILRQSFSSNCQWTLIGRVVRSFRAFFRPPF